jgi:hypothetical protein
MQRLRLWTLGGSLLAACADAGPEPLALRGQAVVYGDNDRRDFYQLAPDAPLRARARSVAAVIPREAVGQGPAGEPILLGQTLAQTFGLCADQPFAQQISAAVCTAFLIDDALLATAGHCFDYALDCQKYLFVFDYVLESAAADVRLLAENIFACTRTRVHMDEMEPGVWKRDYALVELTRRAIGRAPLSLRSEPIVLAEPVSVISASGGLPLKFDQGARVLDARAHVGDFFRLDSDTAHGSSGAPVFDESGQAVGIVTRGRTDYLLDPEAGCSVDNVLPPPELVAPGEPVKFPGHGELYSEEANPIAPALAALCALSYPSPRLCGNAARCGDQICSGDETFELCASDCSEAPPPSAPAATASAHSDSGTEPAETSTAPPEHRHAHPGCALRSASRAAHEDAWFVAFAGLGILLAIRAGRRRAQR